MSAPRVTHVVDIDDIDMAIALGLEVTAECGVRFTPRFSGREADNFPECADCHPAPRRIRGQHRMSTLERSVLPHYVYRCFDAGGRLLYVGCTYNPPARMRQHRGDKQPWIDAVASTRLTVWPDRRKALDMERLAIETERPLHNKAFNKESA